MEAAPRARVRDGAPPGHGLPRRAHGRRRPCRSSPVLGDHLRARLARHDDPRDDALHGRSRTLPASRLPLAWTPDRGRHGTGNPRPVQDGVHRGRVHRAAASRRGSRRMNLIDRLRRASFWPMLRKEFIEMRRDRFTLAMLIGIPAVQLVLFGYAVQTDVRNIPTVVLDESRTSQSRRLVEMMANTRNFRIVGTAANRNQVREAIERGDAAAAIIIPPEFASDLKRGHTARAQVIVDAADPLSSQAAIGAAALVGARSGAELSPRPVLVVAAPLEVRVRPWYNPEGRNSPYIVP